MASFGFFTLTNSAYGVSSVGFACRTMEATIKYALCLIFIFIVTACGVGGVIGLGPYDDLESSFPSTKPLTNKPIAARTIILDSRRHKGAFTYRDIVDIRLSKSFVEFVPHFPAMKAVEIPMASISGCSKTCFGGGSDWEANIIVGATETEIGIPASQEVIEWCWSNHLPMISGKDRRDWLYSHKPLPAKSGYSKQLSSRSEYDKQTKMNCMGY